jgi:hypothetical protein
MLCRLKEAAAAPGNLTQETIIKNLDVKEKQRLDKIRNIGIAVRSIPIDVVESSPYQEHRRISTVAKQLLLSEFSSTPGESMQSTKFAGEMLWEQKWIPWS